MHGFLFGENLSKLALLGFWRCTVRFFGYCVLNLFRVVTQLVRIREFGMMLLRIWFRNLQFNSGRPQLFLHLCTSISLLFYQIECWGLVFNTCWDSFAIWSVCHVNGATVSVDECLRLSSIELYMIDRCSWEGWWDTAVVSRERMHRKSADIKRGHHLTNSSFLLLRLISCSAGVNVKSILLMHHLR